jgi:hypothetical protein
MQVGIFCRVSRYLWEITLSVSRLKVGGGGENNVPKISISFVDVHICECHVDCTLHESYCRKFEHNFRLMIGLFWFFFRRRNLFVPVWIRIFHYSSILSLDNYDMGKNLCSASSCKDANGSEKIRLRFLCSGSQKSRVKSRDFISGSRTTAAIMTSSSVSVRTVRVRSEISSHISCPTGKLLQLPKYVSIWMTSTKVT